MLVAKCSTLLATSSYSSLSDIPMYCIPTKSLLNTCTPGSGLQGPLPVSLRQSTSTAMEWTGQCWYVPWYWIVALVVKLAVCLWSKALVAWIDQRVLGRLTIDARYWGQVQDALLPPTKVWDAGKTECAVLSICQALSANPTLELFSYCAIAGHYVARSGSEVRFTQKLDSKHFILGHSSEDVQLVDLVVQVVLVRLSWPLVLLQRLATKPFDFKRFKKGMWHWPAPVSGSHKGCDYWVVVLSACLHLNKVEGFNKKSGMQWALLWTFWHFVQPWLIYSWGDSWFRRNCHHARHVFHVLLSSKSLHLIYFCQHFENHIFPPYLVGLPPGVRMLQGSRQGFPAHFVQPKFPLSWRTKVKCVATEYKSTLR